MSDEFKTPGPTGATGPYNPKPPRNKSTKIVLNRQSDLILNNAKIVEPVGIVLKDIDGVEEAFAKEAKSRQVGDAKLQDQIDNVLSNVDPESLDSLKEIVVAFEGADKDLNGAIKDLSMAASKALDSEAKAREEADAKEAKEREEADAKEATARKEADSTEAKERQTADKKEASTREKADARLQDQIDNVLSNIDPKSLDSLTEIVAAFEAADKDLNGAIKDLSLAASKALDEVEENLESKIADIISNTDLTAIDSFTEVVQRVDSEYYQKLDVNETPDGTITRFTFTTWNRSSSESIFLNGLLLTEKEDYNVVSVSGNIAAVDFIVAPEVGDRVKAYGVYATDAVSVEAIHAQIAKLEMILEATKMQIEEIINNQASSNAKLAEATEKLTANAEDMASFRTESTQLETEKVTIEEKIAQQETALNAANMELVDESQNIEVYAKRKAEAEAAIVNATDSCASTEQIIRDFESYKSQYLADTPTEEIDQAKIDAFDSNIAEKQEELSISKRNIEVARAEKAGAESDLTDAENNIVELTGTIAAIKETLIMQNAEVKDLAARLSDLTQKLAEAAESSRDLSNQIASLREELASLKASHSKAEISMKKDYATLATLQKQLADLEAAFGGGDTIIPQS